MGFWHLNLQDTNVVFKQWANTPQMDLWTCFFSVTDNIKESSIWRTYSLKREKGAYCHTSTHFGEKPLKSGSALPVCTCSLVYFRAMLGSTFRKVGRTSPFGFHGDTILTTQMAVTLLPVQKLEVGGFDGLVWWRHICLRHNFWCRRSSGEGVAQFCTWWEPLH